MGEKPVKKTLLLLSHLRGSKRWHFSATSCHASTGIPRGGNSFSVLIPHFHFITDKPGAEGSI